MSRRDQAVGEDLLGLADAVGAVDGLRLDGGVPPGVEQVDVVGGGQVQAEAAGLEADQEERAVGVGLEALDRARRGCGCGRRGTRRRCPRWSRRSRTIARKLVNCEKTRTLCPSSTHLGELRQEHVELGAGLAGAARVDQAGVAGGLAEPQERLEDLDLGLGSARGVLDARSERLAVVVAQLVVELALRGLQVAVEGLLGLLGQVLDDLRLGAAEDERPQRLGERARRVLVRRRAGRRRRAA